MADRWHLTGSRTVTAGREAVPPFPDPVVPAAPPFREIPVPEHLSTSTWQTSIYDAASHAPMGVYAQRPAGPCDLTTGRLKDSDWPADEFWQQV
jgi:hypothetical protein